MTKPVFIASPGIFIAADVASVIAPPLERELAAARAIGAKVHPDVAETVERLALLGDAYRSRRKADELSDRSRIDAGPLVAVQWINVRSRSPADQTPAVRDGPLPPRHVARRTTARPLMASLQ